MLSTSRVSRVVESTESSDVDLICAVRVAAADRHNSAQPQPAGLISISTLATVARACSVPTFRQFGRHHFSEQQQCLRVVRPPVSAHPRDGWLYVGLGPDGLRVATCTRALPDLP